MNASCRLLLAGSAEWAWVSALLAGVLSFASPKESSQRKGDPRVGAPSGFLPLLDGPGGLPELACGSNMASRQHPARLRCSAPLMGTPKASALSSSSQKTGFHGQPEKAAKNEICHLGTQAQLWIGSLGPLKGAEQRRGWREKGEDCLRAKPEFRSPRQSRVAQGTGAAGTDPGVAFSLATFFWRSKRKYARPQGGTPCHPEPQANKKGKSPIKTISLMNCRCARKRHSRFTA